MKKIYRPEELAKKIGVTERVLLDWRDLGMPWVKIGKAIYIFEDSFIRWVKTQERVGVAQDASGQDLSEEPIQ